MNPATATPDSTAVRVALWRALHVELDAPPHVLDDTVGLQLADPDPDWRARGDMDPEGTRAFRASIVARARYLDDLVTEHAAAGVEQYVILGAGLDTFAQRHPDVAVRIFEVDQPGTQEWKRGRLVEIGYSPGENLTKEATEATLQQVAAWAHGSVFAMTFMLPLDLVDEAERPMQESVEAAAAGSGTPFISHYGPDEMTDMCRATGFSSVKHVSPDDLTARYFAGRADGLRPPSAEHLIVATV
jgi:O-methyltransferase involved in polyketide biosynthesis